MIVVRSSGSPTAVEPQLKLGQIVVVNTASLAGSAVARRHSTLGGLSSNRSLYQCTFTYLHYNSKLGQMVVVNTASLAQL